MTEDRDRYAGQGESANDDSRFAVYVIPKYGGRSSVEGMLKIGGRLAGLHLGQWLDGETEDTQAAARAALRRAALAFLEELGPE